MTGDEVTWIVADVTGKGISAALVVSMLKGFCKTIFPRNPRPRDMLVELNKLILDELPPEMFLTAVVCHTTPAGTITFANAGHLPMLLLCADPAATPVVARLKPQGVPLGFLAPSEFDGKIEEQQARLARGDMLLLCTDGVTEAVNANNEFFGEKRLIEQLTAMRGQSVEEALTRLRRTLDEFQGATAQHDDITIVLGQY
jgi:sigma-B regulation protein RsbU (phosphoserine phosphatase)